MVICELMEWFWRYSIRELSFKVSSYLFSNWEVLLIRFIVCLYTCWNWRIIERVTKSVKIIFICHHLYSNYILLIQNQKIYTATFISWILERKFHVPSPVMLYSFDTKSRFLFFFLYKNFVRIEELIIRGNDTCFLTENL